VAEVVTLPLPRPTLQKKSKPKGVLYKTDHAERHDKGISSSKNAKRECLFDTI
jgi:hypothetical protein